MYLSRRSIGLLALGFIVFALLELFTGFYYMTALGVALFAAITVKFLQDLGKRIEIRDLIAFMSVMQWILGPVLAYRFLPYDDLYYMAVTEEVYMNFVVPFCFAMVAGLYFPLSNDRIIDQGDAGRVKEYLAEHPWLGYILVVIGLVAGIAGKGLPASFRFILFLITNLQYIGMYMILFSRTRFRWLIFTGIMALATSAAILEGMFGELVQWIILSFIIIAMVIRVPAWGKVLALGIGMFLVMIVQSTKEEYRLATWYTTTTKSNGQIYKEIFLARLADPSSLFNPASTQNMAMRLNQGWIIARILDHMPKKEPFVRGETIKTALFATLLPRFLAPQKARAGGHANFERFTGTPLPETTSMDISLVGEGYANFGKGGALLFIFIISLIYNWVIIKVISLSEKRPVLILWIPLLFFQVMKAETDFATVFNYLVKAAIMTFLVIYITERVQELMKKQERITADVPETGSHDESR